MMAPPTYAPAAARTRVVEAARATPARPLPAATRQSMEGRFGHDFSQVRIHASVSAAESAARLGARAFAVGHDIVFGRGEYRPQTREGQRLLSHELTHVAQWQNGGMPSEAGVHAASRLSSNAEHPLEREAQQASSRLARGGDVTIRGCVPQCAPLLHPVYISRHGDRGFLNLANDFYTRWGYAPVRTGVDSVEEVVADLATKSSIGRVTIVTHAHPTNLFMAFLSGGPNQITKSDWQVDLVDPTLTPEQQRREGPALGELTQLERHYVSESVLEQIIAEIQADSDSAGVLARVGSATDPILRQFVWWSVEHEYVGAARFQRRRRQQLQREIEERIDAYRDTMLLAVAAAGGGTPAPREADFDRLRQVVRDVAQTYEWPRARQQEQVQAARQLTGSPTAAINRVLRDPAFAANLAAVRAMISNDSWIEIQGCRAGQDADYLRNMKRFFASDRAEPSVSAPDWFQFFGNYGFRSPVADTPASMRRLWRQQRVRRALAHWYPIVMGGAYPDDPTHETLRDYLRAPHVLPLSYPGQRTRGNDFIVLSGMPEDAFLAWFSRHSYRLTTVQEIRDQLFTQRGPARNIGRTIVDWLQEDRRAPTQMLFRPDPEYRQHIITV